MDDFQAILDRLAADGYPLIGGVGQYEGIWRMASVRGPEGIIVSLAQRVDWSAPIEAAGRYEASRSTTTRGISRVVRAWKSS